MSPAPRSTSRLFSFSGLFACLAASALASGDPARPLLAAPPGFEEQVAELVNRERVGCSARGCPLPPLKLVGVLSGVARAHSRSMAELDYFSHCDRATRRDPFERLLAAGYSYRAAAENIAGGGDSPAAAMAQWMASRPHRANILASDFRELGVGYFLQTGDAANVDWDANGDCDCADRGESCRGPALTDYWTELFGRRDSHYPLVIAGERPTAPSASVELYLYAPARAGSMRLRNDGGSWSPWQAYSPSTVWRLGDGDGLRTVFSEVSADGMIHRACDTIQRTGSGFRAAALESVVCDVDGTFREAAP
ncbi:MAG: CAP domain-containing protein [Thermoanaerobaculia bacterium]